MPVGLGDVRDVLAGVLRDVEAIHTSPVVMRELLNDLRNAERTLGKRLRDQMVKHGALDARFTGAQALAMQQQVLQAIDYVQDRLRGRTKEQAEAAINAGLQRTITTMEGLEQRFEGIVTPLRLRQAAELSKAKANARGMWGRDFPTTVDRYGDKMMSEFEEIIRAGFVAGSSMDDIIAALVGHGGPTGKVSMAATITPAGVLRVRESDIPEGLFVRHKYWAERIVRTEMLKAYNGARQVGLETTANDHPTLKRKILAVLDKRTAPDSVAVHGQIRGIKEHFVDGAGRSYLYPPARPNDRETVIPWKEAWDDSSSNMSEWEKVCIGEGDAATEAKLERTMRAIAAGQTGAKATGVPKAPKPPMEQKKRPTYHEQVEADFRKRVTTGKWGTSVEIDGINGGGVYREPDGTFTRSIRTRAGFEPGKGGFATREEAMADLVAAWNHRMAIAAKRLEPWDEAKYKAAVAAGDGLVARRHIRGLLYQEGVLPLDALLTDQADLLTIDSVASMPDAHAVHRWGGSVGVRKDIWDDGKSSRPFEYDRHLRVMIHEEVHGATKYSGSGFYAGHGAAIEEATVELTARHITERVTGRKLEYMQGAYHQVIAGIRVQLEAAFMDAGERAPGNGDVLMTDASLTMRTRRGKKAPIDSPTGILKQFVGAVKVPPKVRKALSKRIKQHIKAPR